MIGIMIQNQIIKPNEWVLRRRQFEVVEDKHRFILLVTGRRWAKTTTIIIKMFKEACKTKDGLFGYSAPTYRMVKRIAWKIFKAVIPPSYLAKPPNETELIITLKNGAEICLFGLDRPEFAVGSGYNGWVFDEYDLTKKGVFEAQIRPALADKQGFCWFVGSPDSRRKQLRELKENIEINKWTDWIVYHYKTIEGGYVEDEELRKAQSQTDPRTYREQYEATFEELIGGVYYAFDINANVTQEAVYNWRMPLRLIWDFNVDPFCVSVAQSYSFQDEFRNPYDNIHVIDEFRIRNSNTPEMCNEILKKYGGHKAGIVIYGDSTSRSRDTASSFSDYQIIIDRFHNMPGFSVRIKDKNPVIKDRVNAVNSKLKAYNGKRHIFINPACRYFIKDLMHVVYKEGTTELDKTDLELTHFSDGFGYYIDYEYPVVGGYVR